MMDFVRISCFAIAIFCVEVTCQLSIHRCTGNYFSVELCTPYPNVIEVQSAEFGATTLGCNPDDAFCTGDISDLDPSYYQTILNTCNGNQGCYGLQAEEGTLQSCFGQRESDYVEIFYKCVDETSTTTTSTSTTFTTTTSEPSTTTVTRDPSSSSSATTTTIFTGTTTIHTTTSSNSTNESVVDEGGLSGGAIAGIVIGVLLGIGLIALIITLIVLCRIKPNFASQAKTTIMKPFYMITETKNKKGSRSSSSSSEHGDVAPDILRHPKLQIKHQNVKMNRNTTCRSGVGPEIVLTPQDAGANAPHDITINSLQAPKPSIEIVTTPQEAIRRTKNNFPYSPDKGGTDEENPYEEFDDDYYEFNDEEYAEISDFERTDNPVRKKKPSLKPKPKVNPNHQSNAKPPEKSLSEEILNHLKRKKELQANPTGNDTARSSTLEMTENDDLYYNAGEGGEDADYELAAKVDDKYKETEDAENKYYDLHPNKKHMSMPRKYEQLQIRKNGPENNSSAFGDGPEIRKQRKSQDIYDDDGEYYDDDDDWSTEESGGEYMGEEAVRTSALAMQDGLEKEYNRKRSSEC